jgi:hypothetical protein
MMPFIEAGLGFGSGGATKTAAETFFQLRCIRGSKAIGSSVGKQKHF